MVKVYSLSTCPWCKKVKNLLDEKKVEYDCVEVDLAKGADQKKALAEVEELTGKKSFPVTVVGEVVVQGYKPEEIEGALESEA